MFVREPMFQGQTKERLNNPEMNAAVDNFVRPGLEAWLNNNKTAADQIVGRIVLAAKARLASREAATEVKRKSVTSRRLNLPGKLADCKSTNLADSELFMVEGDSAGGCFSADTRVALADGRALTFEELVKEQADGKEHFCYTIRPDGQIGLERALHARKTKTNAKVLRIWLDNDEVITCTPDHRFMLRDGSYRRADAFERWRLLDAAAPQVVRHARASNHDPGLRDGLEPAIRLLAVHACACGLVQPLARRLRGVRQRALPSR